MGFPWEYHGNGTEVKLVMGIGTGRETTDMRISSSSSFFNKTS